jgi:hypothetical protein
VKRQLKPLLDQLGLQSAFRHGNATMQDQLHTPLKVRQGRLGHASAPSTIGYTHLVSEDDRKLVEQLDQLFCPGDVKKFCAQLCPKKLKPLRRKRKSLRFNRLFGCGGRI